MQKLKTLIVENDEVDLMNLEDLLKFHGDTIEIVGKAESYRDALNLLSENKYQLSILDYKLDSNKDMFELIKNAGRDRFGILVYHSIHRDARLDDVLLYPPDLKLYKPCDEDNVMEFVVELKLEIAKRESANSVSTIVDEPTDLQNFLESMGEKLTSIQKHFSTKLFTITNTPISNTVVNINDIFCVVADDKMTKFYIYDIENQQYICKPSIDSLGLVLERLDKDLFIQCHRSYIVNTTRILRTSKPKNDEERDLSSDGILHLSHPNCRAIPYGGSFKKDLIKKLSARRL